MVTKDLSLNIIVMLCFIFIISYITLEYLKKHENFTDLPFFDKCSDIYPKWARTKNYQYFEKKYPECFTQKHYNKIRETLTNTFKKIMNHNIPIEMVCNVLNAVIDKDIKNPKAVNMFYDSFPKCQKLKNFDVDEFVDKVLSNNVEHFQNSEEEEEESINMLGVNTDMNDVIRILKKKYPDVDISDVEIKVEKDKKIPKKLTYKELLDLTTLSNLTPTQYNKWLKIFREDPEKITSFHGKNLQKIVNNYKLKLKDLPDKHHQYKLYSKFIEKDNLDDIIKIKKNEANSAFYQINDKQVTEYIDKLNYLNFDDPDPVINDTYDSNRLIFESDINLHKTNPFVLDDYLRPKLSKN